MRYTVPEILEHSLTAVLVHCVLAALFGVMIFMLILVNLFEDRLPWEDDIWPKLFDRK